MRDKKYLDMSRNKLKKFCETRIKTTMIGALDAIEKGMGDLWNDNSTEALALREKFADVRQIILDNGNRQIRLLDKEFDNYEVELLRYHITLINGRNQDGRSS